MIDDGTIWVTIALLAVATITVKATGPLLTGGRALPPKALSVIALLPATLLAALVVTGTLTDSNGDYTIGASAAGVAAAGAVVWRGGSILPAVIAAAVVTAVLRALQ